MSTEPASTRALDRDPGERDQRIAAAIASADLRPLARAFIAAALEVRAHELDTQPPPRPRGSQPRT